MNEMQVLKDVIIRARSLIDIPDKWTRGALARTSTGVPVSDDDSRAVCFCGTGALSKAGVSFPTLLFKSLGVLRCSIPQFNDSHCHADILALFDEAIAACDTCKPILNPTYFLRLTE